MVKFIVDSTFAASKEYVKEHDIRVVNLKLILDGVETDEGFREDWAEFYSRYEKSKTFPTTSQPSPAAFEAALSDIFAKDENAEVIVLTIASELSGTVNSARLAATGFLGKKIAIIDSKSGSACETMLMEELVAFAESGGSFEDTCELASRLIPQLAVQFIPDSMEYLHRGGRIGKLGVLLANIMSVKPIFEFKNNITALPRKVLGLSRGLLEMIKRLPAKIKRLYIIYIHDSTHVQALEDKLKQLLGIGNVTAVPVSPVFGIHVGIGAIGFACMEQSS